MGARGSVPRGHGCLSSRDLCYGLITRPEESYRLWCVIVCDLETLKNEEAKTRKWVAKKSGNVCYHSVQNLLSSSLLSKNVKIKIYRTIILPVVLYGCES
jgi:hypothetical protein